ncbi:MAG TPA: hypothetical protein VF796_19115 [Humisphaera sp.]
MIVVALSGSGCREPAATPAATRPSTQAAPSFNITFFYSDGTWVTKAVPFMDAAAADAVVRPFIVAAANAADGSRRPIGWTIDDKRAVGDPVAVEDNGSRGEMRMSTHTFREYRVVDTTTDNQARRELHARTSPTGEFMYWAQLHPDPEGVQHAVGYVLGDAKMFREVATFKFDPRDH